MFKKSSNRQHEKLCQKGIHYWAKYDGPPEFDGSQVLYGKFCLVCWARQMWEDKKPTLYSGLQTRALPNDEFFQWFHDRRDQI